MKPFKAYLQTQFSSFKHAALCSSILKTSKYSWASLKQAFYFVFVLFFVLFLLHSHRISSFPVPFFFRTFSRCISLATLLPEFVYVHELPLSLSLSTDSSTEVSTSLPFLQGRQRANANLSAGKWRQFWEPAVGFRGCQHFFFASGSHVV